MKRARTTRARRIKAEETKPKESKLDEYRDEIILVSCAAIFIVIMLMFQPDLFTSILNPSGLYTSNSGTVWGQITVSDSLCSKNLYQYKVNLYKGGSLIKTGYPSFDGTFYFRYVTVVTGTSNIFTVSVSGPCTNGKSQCSFRGDGESVYAFLTSPTYDSGKLPIIMRSGSAYRVGVSDYATNAGLPSARVSWTNFNGISDSGSTGTSIFYVNLGVQPAGSLKLTASKSGYVTQSKTVTVTGCSNMQSTGILLKRA